MQPIITQSLSALSEICERKKEDINKILTKDEKEEMGGNQPITLPKMHHVIQHEQFITGNNRRPKHDPMKLPNERNRYGILKNPF